MCCHCLLLALQSGSRPQAVPYLCSTQLARHCCLEAYPLSRLQPLPLVALPLALLMQLPLQEACAPLVLCLPVCAQWRAQHTRRQSRPWSVEQP